MMVHNVFAVLYFSCLLFSSFSPSNNNAIFPLMGGLSDLHQLMALYDRITTKHLRDINGISTYLCYHKDIQKTHILSLEFKIHLEKFLIQTSSHSHRL